MITPNRTEEILFECSKCGYSWDETIKLPMEVGAALARMKGWSICPRCGAKGEAVVFRAEEIGLRG